MNKQKIILFLAGILVAVLGNAQTGSIKIEIEGVDNANGKIRIGVYNSAEDFPNFEDSFAVGYAVPNTLGTEFIFKEVLIGDYVIALWHDENDDQELNKNMFGIPKEKYGFSNNAKGSFGPPDFKDATFAILEGETSVLKINLK